MLANIKEASDTHILKLWYMYIDRMLWLPFMQTDVQHTLDKQNIEDDDDDKK